MLSMQSRFQDWCSLSAEQRGQARRAYRYHHRPDQALRAAALAIAFGAALATMSALVISDHDELKTYTKTSCVAREIGFVKCRISGPLCVEAVARVESTRQEVAVRYPPVRPLLTTWWPSDVADVLQKMRAGAFECYVKNSASGSDAVTTTDVKDIKAWHFMLGLGCSSFVFAVVCMVAALAWDRLHRASLELFRREEPQLSFLAAEIEYKSESFVRRHLAECKNCASRSGITV